MHRSLLISLFLLSLLLTCLEGARAESREPLSLDDAFALTLRNSERLKLKKQEIRLAEAQYRQAIAAIFPQITAGLQQRFRDNEEFGRVSAGRLAFDDAATSPGGRSSSFGRTQAEGVISVEQILFSGFREFLLADAIELSVEALNFEFLRKRELLFQDVADVYYQILYATKTLDIYAETERTLKTRIRELNEYRALGKSRESEVLAAQADLADVVAASERTRGLLHASRELLSFLTGVPADELRLTSQTFPAIRSPLETYLARARQRFDIRAAEMRIAARRRRILAAERRRWPTISLQGNGFAVDDPDRNREWELVASLTLPVFDGGRIEAEVDAERAELTAEEIFATELLRICERDVRIAYANVRSAQAEYASLEELRAAALRNLDSQRKDYAFGVVTNLEVLQAIRRLLEAERRLLEAQVAINTNTARLLVAAGDIPLIGGGP